jgi:Domain of unknown function (DUF4082)/Abnormal spindle-like microcephaly-assoc'd, ASPM-SPD-2-Hydin
VLVPRNSFVFRSLGPLVSTFTPNFTIESPNKSPKQIRLLFLLVDKLFRPSRLGKLSFLALTCCLAFVSSASGQLTIISSSAKPAQVDSNDSNPVEIGVKFRADTNGSVTGLRFYKATTNVGTHVGHIWSKSGILLGSATFTSETKSGWQQVNFSSPIPVSANTTYIASYFAPSGHYSVNDNFFTKTGIDNAPLHELANGVDGPDGVYKYGSSSGFPTSTYESDNYWVDVVYTPQTTAATPQLTLSATALNFGSVTVNSAATQSLTLTSSGSSALTINSAAITGAGYSIVGGTLPTTLNPGQTTTLQLQLKPTAAGTVTGQLTISSNSSTGSTSTVSLSGTATAATKPQLSASPSSLSFGSVATNSSATLSETITSSGSSALTVSSASVTGAGFTLVAGSFPATLNPGQALTLQVKFTPTATGAATGKLTISSNSASGATAVISLSGTGTTPGTPQLTVSATSLSFGSVATSSSAKLSLTLTSSGTSAVTVNSAAISGAGFSIIGGSFPLTLNASQTATVNVQFAPTAAGAETGKLTITSNATSGSPALVALSGTGTSVPHSVSLTWSAPPPSAAPVAGYNVYRAISGGALQLLNQPPDTSTSYVDSTVVAGALYDYVVKSVNSAGVESVPSNVIAVTIPTP